MKNFFFILLTMLLFAACHPFELTQDETAVINADDKTMDQLAIPNNFTFDTHKQVGLTFSVKDNKGQLMSHIPFKVFLKTQDETDSTFLFSAYTNTEGVYQTALSLGTDAERLIAITDYIGLPSYQTIAVNSNSLALSFGDENNVTKPHTFWEKTPELAQKGFSPDALNFNYIGNYDANGVPRYLMPKGDAVSQDILNIVNASLPEGITLPNSHPEYLANTAQHNVVLKAKAEVWVTFVHEGAGYRNSVGYYSYPTNNPPTSAAQISNLTLIFPNASFQGSGGGLRTGDKVLLDTFEAGTTIGWFLVPDGWNGSTQRVVENQKPVRYSDKNLNTFTSSAYRQHIVTLLDPARELLLVGFEDLNRPSGDNDFNDAVMYATASPFSAIETANMVTTTSYGTDTDGDGIPDTQDIEPTNPAVASYNYTPSLNHFNTLAFEDFWPQKGDYDMNDVVVDYNVQEYLNAANKITQLKYKITLRALGGSFRNGFGFELPIPSSKVASVQGAKMKDNYITLNANGTEAGQNKTVIIGFDNGFNLISALGGGFVNTEKGKATITPYTFDVTVTLNTPVTRAELGNAPYNPFIIVNKERGKEVHLPGYTPTTLANTALFKTGDDDTGSGKYYQTKKNLPWGIHVSNSFQYPSEKMPINRAYLKFNKWAESGGSSFSDWFQNKSNYRNTTNIY
jgi:LruC domain-containing protein